MAFFKITPDYLDSYINFFYGKDNWHYNPQDPPIMQKIQVEGAAKIWNLLCDHGISLLSDEVGMGKTLQALAVIVTLWRQKPDAKVLLYAPNTNVALKWRNEYGNFIRYHYRTADDKIKSSINDGPLRSAIYCENHVSLLEQVNLRWPSFCINKISALSNFGSEKINQEVLDSLGIPIQRSNPYEESDLQRENFMTKLAIKSNELIRKNFSSNENNKVDLLIVDEAHYLRRSEGDSNKSKVAHGLFSGIQLENNQAPSNYSLLAEKVLLLTATPNHSSSKDICNIVSFFKPEWKKREAEEVLKEICIRRYRRLNGKTKHEYRDEIAEPVEMTSLKEKLFFAAYQKKLVHAQSLKKLEDKKANPYRVLFGYLEGFEFLPSEKDKEDKKAIVDFRTADDTDVIVELSNDYKKCYGRNSVPNHPKYDNIIKLLTPANSGLNFSLPKRLVFVRRIASVSGISKRLINDYDKWLIEILRPIMPSKFRKKAINFNKLRGIFWNEARKDSNSQELDDEKTSQEDVYLKGKKIPIPFSQVLDLFTIKKESGSKYKTTDCSNFRRRFSTRKQMFSIFFQPPSDYLNAGYSLESIVYSDEIKKGRLYLDSTYKERIQNISDPVTQKYLKDYYGLIDETEKIKESRDHKFSTVLELYFKQTYENTDLRGKVMRSFEMYKEWTIFEKEGFSDYLKKGILFASPFIVHFYVWFKEVEKKVARGEELYKLFCEKVNLHLEDSGIAELIANAILTFQIFYKKELAKTDKELLDNAFTFLENTYPVYPYCGDTKRPTILNAFNSPFFPNVIVATSVLQEGVDLHYHCAEVIHYGIAWTQGDNEQRVGRVDRMNGKLEHLLGESDSTILPIRYPYLAKSLDEFQVKRFAYKKHQSEKIIDQLKNPSETKEINILQEDLDENWTKLFNHPKKQFEIREPFDVLQTDFSSIIIPELLSKGINSHSQIVKIILNTLGKYFKEELFIFEEKHSGNIAAIKHKRKYPDNHFRDQPLFVDLSYFEPGIFFTGKPVYILSLKTPMTYKGENFIDRRYFGRFKSEYQNLPFIKICLNNEVRRSRMKYYIRVDLPVFSNTQGELNISEGELLYYCNKLITFSDEFESHMFWKSDIKNEEVIPVGDIYIKGDKILSKDRKSIDIIHDWESNSEQNILYREKTLPGKYDHYANYLFNHNTFLKRRENFDNVTIEQIAIYEPDILDDEIRFLNRLWEE